MFGPYSDRVRRVLLASGWTEGRQVDAATVIGELERDGVGVHAKAREFLTEFYGLHVSATFQTRDGRTEQTGVYFEVINKGMIWETRADLRFVESLLSTTLCPVGYDGRSDVYLNPHAEVFLCDVDWAGISRSRSVAEFFETQFTDRFPEFFETIHLDRERRRVGISKASWVC